MLLTSTLFYVIDSGAAIMNEFKVGDNKLTPNATNIVRPDEAGDAGRPKITFIEHPKATSASGATAPSDTAPAGHRVLAVPEVSYKLHDGAQVWVTFTGKSCRSLVDQSEQSNVHGREVGGALVGYWFKRRGTDGKPQHEVIVTNALSVTPFDSSSLQISFTESAWKQAEEEIPAPKVCLGWYHTHPFQGIFFSADDTKAHRLFSEPYQFALVITPQAMVAGLFHWSFDQETSLAGPIYFNLR
jgi:proteasome lid subunit RPN8/RPN11